MVAVEPGLIALDAHVRDMVTEPQGVCSEDSSKSSRVPMRKKATGPISIEFLNNSPVKSIWN